MQTNSTTQKTFKHVKTGLEKQLQANHSMLSNHKGKAKAKAWERHDKRANTF